jgi:hypothetical protein
MITCWISLHETQADAGPLEFVRGSHTWPKSPPSRTQFHAPDDWLAGARAAAPEDDESFFPVVWDESGYRTPWLAELSCARLSTVGQYLSFLGTLRR